MSQADLIIGICAAQVVLITGCDREKALLAADLHMASRMGMPATARAIMDVVLDSVEYVRANGV